MYYLHYWEKEKNALIIHSAKNCYQQKFYHFITMPFSKHFAHPSLRARCATDCYHQFIH